MNLLFALVLAVTTAPLDTATFAGGCFWSMERAFDQVAGVVAVTVGYTGGTMPHPSYEQVSTGQTGHLESVQVVYDPRRIAYERLVDAFWHDIDPTQADGQFCDHGPEYHTAIFYRDSTEYRVAAASRRALERRFEKPIVTEIVPATAFYPAEQYHQHYTRRSFIATPPSTAWPRPHAGRSSGASRSRSSPRSSRRPRSTRRSSITSTTTARIR